MTPKPVPATTTQVAFRFEDDLLKRVDRHAKRTSGGNRADAVRDLLAQALDQLDEGRERYPTKTRTTVLRWHQPKCSHCDKPIEKIGDGHAGWREDKDRRTYDPMIVHAGGFECSFYSTKNKTSMDVLDNPIAEFRESPMEAIKIALRNRGTRGERAQWLVWISIVLGLPFSVTDLAVLSVDETETTLPNYVPSLAIASEVLGDA